MQTLTKAKNIPALRFPGFLGEWEEKRLEKVSKFWNGKAHERDISENGKYIVVNSKFISRNGKVKKYSDNQASPLKKDDVAIVMSDIPNGKAIGKCFLVDQDEKYTLNQRIGGIKSKEIISSFLIRILNRNKYFLKFDNGVSQTNLRKDEILRCPAIFPSLLEQQKIASFLDSVDEWIQNLREQKKSLEKYKKGMMQKIFSQEIRFKNNDGKNFPEWEEKKFLDVFKTISTRNCQIKNADILAFGKYKVVDQSKNLVAGYSNDSSKLLKTTPIIIFGDHTAILKYIDFDFVVGADGTKILNVKNKDKLKFLYYFLQANPINTEGYKRHYSILKDKKILLPLLMEQQKIAEFLTSIDNLIESKQQQITQAEKWKKGLMQQMFV